jgi:hypothetical protein
MTQGCLPNRPPAPLKIVNGTARTAWAGTAEGLVNSQGVLIMYAPNDARFEGGIDARGAVAGRFTSRCSYRMVWQKAPAPTMPFDGEYIGVSGGPSKTASARATSVRQVVFRIR